jgi:hypothetical protein
MGWMAEFDSRQGLEFSPFFTISSPDLVFNQPRIQWVSGAISQGLKDKNGGALLIPIRLHGVVLN